MRVRLILSLLIAVALLGTVAAAAATAPPVDTVRILFQPFAFSGPLFIAEKEGYFERQRIKVTWVPLNAVDQAIPILAQGQLEVSYGLAPAFFNAVARGEPLRFVADRGHIGGRGSLAGFFVRKDLAGVVKSVADLKGRKVGLPGNFGNLAHYMLVKALAGAGLSFNQVSAVFMPPTAVLAALESGAVEAALLSNPLHTLALERGIGVQIVDVADLIPGEHTALLIYGRNLLVDNRPLGVRAMVAYLQGVRRYSEGPTARNVAIIAEYIKTEPEIIRKGGWLPIHPDGYIDVNRARRYQDWLFEVELISVRSPISALLDPYFVEQARVILGIPSR